MSKASKRKKTLLDLFSEKNRSTGNVNVHEAENVAASEVAHNGNENTQNLTKEADHSRGIRDDIPTALYVHCAAHSLNLAVSNSFDLSSIRNCMETIASVYNFFNAPKQHNVLRRTITTILPTAESQRPVQVCATRLIDRHESVNVFSNLKLAVVEALAEISAWPDRETSPRALQLLSTIRKSEFCIALLFLKKIFGYTVILRKVLPKTLKDFLEAVNIAQDIDCQRIKVAEAKCQA